MPIATTRRWPTSLEVAEKLVTGLEIKQPDIVSSPAARQAIKAALREWFDGGGHTVERKLSRLTEQLKDAIELGNFGPLFEADGVTRTQSGTILKAFQDIYTLAFLDQFDEEGNLL